MDAATAAVEILNVAAPANDPAGIVTVFPPGKNAAGSLLDSVTNASTRAAGRSPERETVPVTVVAPPTTEVAFRATCLSNGGTTVNWPFSVTRWYVAEIVTGVDAATSAVEILNVAACDPAGIVTEFPSGKNAAGSLLDNVTNAPSSGAGPPRETVPVIVAPARTDLAPRIMEVSFMVTCASNGGRPDVLRTT